MEEVPVPHPKPTAPLSLSELRENLQAHLKESGALRTLKTHLRSIVLTQVAKHPQQANLPLSSVPWSSRAADVLVENHLRYSQRHFTLSVFSSEVVLPSAGTVDSDLALFLVQPYVSQPCASKSALMTLVENQMGTSTGRDKCTVGIQTGESDAPSLEHKLALIDSQFALKFAKHQTTTTTDYELKLAAHRQELEAEMKVELAFRMNQFRQKELAEARKQEEDKYQLILRHKLEEYQELERTAQHRIELERTRLSQLKQELEFQGNSIEKRQKEYLELAREREHFVEQ